MANPADDVIDDIIIRVGWIVAGLTGGTGFVKNVDWMLMLSAVIALLTIVSLCVRIWVDVRRDRRDSRKAWQELYEKD